jgi:hypothetical protein
MVDTYGKNTPASRKPEIKPAAMTLPLSACR